MARTNLKPLIFISHIDEEKEIALALKQLIEASFLSAFDVFVSASPSSIKMGDKWLDTITDALKRCSVEIIIASPASVKRPWINFEAGAAWVRGNPTIPLCHSGMTRNGLPVPLGSLQAALADDAAQLRSMFQALAGVKEMDVPSVDFAPFIEKIKSFEQVSRQIDDFEKTSPVATTDGLTAPELATLQIVAGQTGLDGSVSYYAVRNDGINAGYQEWSISLGSKMLARKGLLESFQADDRGDVYTALRLTEKGWTWLNDNQHRLECRRTAPERPVGDQIPF